MPSLLFINSIDDLRCRTAAWDDLWNRSGVTSPTARAELVALWLEQFAPAAGFCAVVVQRAGTWLAALPLVATRVARLVTTGAAPVNDWTVAGDLLLDLDCDTDWILDLLVLGVAQLSLPVIRFDEARLGARDWEGLHAAFVRAGMPTSVEKRYMVARLEIDHDWDAFVRRWSQAFRSQTLRGLRRLNDAGEINFQTRQSFDPETLEAWLRTGFEVEHRSWKGRAGTSVLASGMLPFFLRQAGQLADWGQLQLAMLRCDGRPIAFGACAVAKGVLHVIKLGYDESYAKCSPGRLLEYSLFREIWDKPAYHAVDFTGMLSDSQRHWKPSTYQIGRLVVGSRGWLGRVAVHAHQSWWPRLRRARQWWRNHGRNRTGGRETADRETADRETADRETTSLSTSPPLSARNLDEPLPKAGKDLSHV